MTARRGGPIRIAHTSDLHIDERGRLDDVRAVLDAFLDDVHGRRADLIVIAGDHFERRSTPVERIVLADFLQRAARVAPVFAVRGNHDAARDLEVFGRLEADQPVAVFDRPTSAPGSAPIWPIGGHQRVGLLALPWFDKSHLVAMVGVDVDQETTRTMTIEAARGLLTCLRHEATRIRELGAVPILAGHVMVAGSEVSTGQTLIGTTVELSPADIFEVGAAYAALGHVHMTQEWHGGRVCYSGSPHRCNYGEKEAKGYRLVTLTEDGEFVSNEFRELPARRMVFFEEDMRTPFDRAVGIAIEPHEVKDALVRLRIRVTPEGLKALDQAALEKRIRDLGAADVKVEPIVEATVRARTPEIVQLESVSDKVLMYITAKNINCDGETWERLLGKLSRIEEVVRATA